MKPLRVGVNMSRAHYERELQDVTQSKRSKARGPEKGKALGYLPCGVV